MSMVDLEQIKLVSSGDLVSPSIVNAADCFNALQGLF